MAFRALPLIGALVLAGCVAPEPASQADTVATADSETEVLDQGMPALPADVLSNAEKAACIANGGTIDRRGMIQMETCVTPYADAGKVCTDGAQCQGRCIAEGTVGSAPGEAVQGICERDDRTFGCFGIVEDGKIEAGLCVD